MIDVEGWSIVATNGQLLLGRIEQNVLEPVYTLHCMMQMVQPDPRQAPQMAIMRTCQPVLTYASISRVVLAPGYFEIPCATLTISERRELAKSVDACEQLKGAMRAQESGIVIAPANSVPARSRG